MGWKGIGITLVVMGHYNMPDIQPAIWSQLRDIFYTFHMPLFMLLSGCLFGYQRVKIDSIAEYASFARKKAIRLIIPYLTISFLLVAIKLVAGKFVKLEFPVTEDLGYFVLLNPSGGFATFLWFIYTLFIIFTVFPIIRKLIRHDAYLFLIIYLLTLLPWPKEFCLNHVFHYLPFFFMGFFLAQGDVLQKIINGPFNLIILAVGFAAIYYARKYVPMRELPNKTLALLLGMAGILSVLSLSHLILGMHTEIFKILSLLGKYSTGIYLLHTISMGPARIFLFQFLGISGAYFILSAAIVCSIGLAIPILIEKYLIKPSSVLSRLILGIYVR